jgi:2'-5' RNA ligase
VLRYFAALLPPQEIQEKIDAFFACASFPHAITSKPGHIKVITKDGMDPYTPWLDIVTQVASTMKPCTVSFGQPEFLGDYLLAIPVNAPALIDAHNASVKAMVTKEAETLGRNPDELAAFYENQSLFTPYLTLASGQFGKETFIGSNPKKRQLLKKACKVLQKLPSFTATEFTLYEASVFDRSYEPKGVVAFGADATVTQSVTLPQIALA